MKKSEIVLKATLSKLETPEKLKYCYEDNYLFRTKGDRKYAILSPRTELLFYQNERHRF